MIIYFGIAILFLLSIIVITFLLVLRNIIALREKANLIGIALLNFEKNVFDDMHVIRTELRYFNDLDNKNISSFDKAYLQDVRSNISKRE